MDKTQFTKFVNSAGGIIVNQKNQVAIIKMPDNDWGFPKGSIDEGGSHLTAAKREVYEETGLADLKMVKEFEPYQRPNGSDPQELKTIYMFLFRTSQEELKSIEPDVIEAKWVNKDKVTTVLTYPKDIEFFEKIKSEL